MENSIGEIDLNMKKSLKDIYSKIFCRIEEQYIIVFLCGGASTKSKKSLACIILFSFYCTILNRLIRKN